MKLIARKPCSYGGIKYYIGDEIPAEYVLYPKAQEQMGILSIVSDGAEPSETISEDTAPEPTLASVEITVQTDEGDVALNVPVEELQTIFNILASNAENGVETVPLLNSGDSLILLHVVDSRKAIKVAAEARGKALASEESAGEQ